jgi:hypothetical protein
MYKSLAVFYGCEKWYLWGKNVNYIKPEYLSHYSDLAMGWTTGVGISSLCHHVRTSSGDPPSWGVMPTVHLHIVLRLRMLGTIPPLVFMTKVKGKAVPVLFFLTGHHAMQAYWGSESIAPLVL